MSDTLSGYEPDQLVSVADGEFAGWKYWSSDPFEQRAGPFYERIDADGRPVMAFRAEPRHMNGGGVMHGGCLVTFADGALFTIARQAMGGAHGVTQTLASDFLDPVAVGALVEARGEVVRAGYKTIFVQGLATADGTPVLRFNGVIRLIRRT